MAQACEVGGVERRTGRGLRHLQRLDRRQFVTRGDRGLRQVVLGLKVHPELGRRAKHPRQPQRRVRGQRLFLAHQPLDPRPVLQPHGLGQGAGRQAEVRQKVLAQMLARMRQRLGEGGVIVGGYR